jgi:protein gp37
MIFVNSMSDLFHKRVDGRFLDSVFDAMEEADWHVYQVLTKRSSVMRRYIRRRYGSSEVPKHIWLGVSVEDAAHKGRIDHLRQIRSGGRFISFEPLLGSMGPLNLRGMSWAIVGGESGPGARAMKPAWAIEVRDQCACAEVAFFFKQWGGARPKSGGRLLEGEEWNGFPWHLLPSGMISYFTGRATCAE